MGCAAAAVTVNEQSRPAGRDPREAMSYELGYSKSDQEQVFRVTKTMSGAEQSAENFKLDLPAPLLHPNKHPVPYTTN